MDNSTQRLGSVDKGSEVGVEKFWGLGGGLWIPEVLSYRLGAYRGCMYVYAYAYASVYVYV